MRQERRLAEALGCEVEPEARGGASRTYRLTGTDHIVSVPDSWPDQVEPTDELVRRTTLQGLIAERVTVPVPRVVRALPDLGLVVVRRLPGIRLIDATPPRRKAVQRRVAAAVGTLLAELHTWEPEAYQDVATIDDYSPGDWLHEAAELAEDLGELLEAGRRDDVRRFLARPALSPADTLVLSHNDLGMEHILVSTTPTAPPVAGVIDWDDAAVGDPAYDFGLLLRDLGPDALDTALAAYAAAGGGPRGLAERAIFYARCKLLEDLVFGHTEDRPEYVEKSLAAWTWTFDTGSGA